MSAKDTYTIVVEVEPFNDIPVIIRLKSFLKRALRDWRIRCRRIEPLIEDSTLPPTPTTAPMCGCGDNTPEKSGRNGRP